MQALNFSCAPLMARMKHALAQPSFFRDGGTIRFACHHMYPYVSFVTRDTQPHLKGADACFVAMARSLGLGVGVRLCGNLDPRGNVMYIRAKEATLRRVRMKNGERELIIPFCWNHSCIMRASIAKSLLWKVRKAAPCCYC